MKYSVKMFSALYLYRSYKDVSNVPYYYQKQ